MTSPPQKAKPFVPGLAARKAAAKLLGAVVDGGASLSGLTDNEHGNPAYLALNAKDRALVRAILAVALRYRLTIASLIARRLQRPLPGAAIVLQRVLEVAAAQILFLDVPDSAAVDLAVEHAKTDPRTGRFANLVNGVLRNLVRIKARALPAALAQTDDMPSWFRERLVAHYGIDKALSIAAMHRTEAPTDFTVREDAEGWAQKLGGLVLPSGSVRVENLEGSVAELPGYSDGQWWVQDAAAALPARLLGDLRGLRVADLCAAPGGKTAQLAAAGAKVTAVEQSASRARRLRENLERLKLEAEIVEADLRQWKPTKLFDAVLLDAPCSSTGTVRRHPDILWSKKLSDVKKLADVQLEPLGAASDLVRPGGTLVFSNCSLDPIEGEELVPRFLADHPEMQLAAIRPQEVAGLEGCVTPEGFLRTTPADLDLGNPARSGLDGFFAARFVRGV